MEAFFGSASGSLFELEWFSDQAWNTAVAASRSDSYQAASILFSTSAFVLSQHPAPQIKQKGQTKIAYLRGAEAVIAHFDKHPGSTLNDAKNMVKCARNISCPDDPETENLLLFLDFGVACRLKQKAAATRILERCRVAKHCKAKHLLQHVMIAKDGSYRDSQICCLGLTVALQKFMEETPLLFDQIFEVRRCLIQLSVGDTDKLVAYTAALEMIKTYKSHSAAFPEKELKWLVTSCWNYGCHLTRFRKWQLSNEYLHISLKLAEHCPAMSGRRHRMEEDVQKLMATMR